MITIINLVADAIMTLKPNLQYTLNGSPTNEAEFNANFQRVTGEDSDGTAINAIYQCLEIADKVVFANGSDGAE